MAGPMLLAAAAPLPFLSEVVALLAASVGVAYICQRLGLVPIVGFLLAGVLIGPYALGLVQDQELIDAAAEIGIILLLFTIGIEFSLERLGRIKRVIFVGGGLQVALTIGVVTALLMPFGVAWNAAVFTGCLVALSSTAIVLKLLADRGETGTAPGQNSLGILIFQDLAIIVMVLLVPILAGQGGGPLAVGAALGKAAVIIVLVLVFARRIMPKVLERVAFTCSHELFLLAVITICFGTAWLTSLAGVSLSLGAFLAGLVVSESRFSQHAFSEILPLQILFSATFFVSVGMLLDIGFVVSSPMLVVGAIAVVLLIKAGTAAASVRLLGQPLPVAAASGLLLAQVGEFSFVLERAGRGVGLTPAGLGEAGAQTFIAATVILMVATPFLADLGSRVHDRLLARPAALPASEPAHAGADAGHPSWTDHVIIGGYGDGARRLVSLLRDAQVPHVVLTLSPDGADEAEQDASPVIRGDYTRQHILGLAGIGRARMLVVADDEPATAHQVVAVARALNPDLRIVVRTRRTAEAPALLDAGADRVIPEELESVVQLAAAALGGNGTAPEEVEAQISALRAAEYARAGRAAGSRAGEAAAVNLPPEVLRSSRCSHLRDVQEVLPSAAGCEECLRSGDSWVHLRICMTCGHVGCCDTSKNKHATKHFHASAHPIIRSWEAGEDWAWCYVDRTSL